MFFSMLETPQCCSITDGEKTVLSVQVFFT